MWVWEMKMSLIRSSFLAPRASFSPRSKSMARRAKRKSRYIPGSSKGRFTSVGRKCGVIGSFRTVLLLQFLQEPGHVLAESFHGRHSFRVTLNLSDFPAEADVPV